MRLATALLLAAALQAAEPIAGTWHLKRQEVAGQETASRPLTLHITASGDTLAFEYAVVVNQRQQVSLRFAARLDGSPADVKDAADRKIGTARLTRAGPSRYLLQLEGPNRPTSAGSLTVSADGKTLTSESDAAPPGGAKVRTMQVFERQ
jgi:hypothetical protein